MATVTIKPDADGTGATLWSITGGESSRFASINHGTDSADDTKYIRNSYSEGNPAEVAFFGFENTPSDFDVATSVTAKVRQLCYTNDDSAKYQIFESDGTTALTNEIELECDGSEIGHTHPHNFRTDSITLTITGATTKTAWDGLLMKITHVGGGDGDDPDLQISEIDLDLVYTATSGGGDDGGGDDSGGDDSGGDDSGGGGTSGTSDALISILNAETTITDLLGSRIYVGHAPQKVATPYCVVTVMGSDELQILHNTIGSRIVRFDIDIYAQRSVTAEAVSRAIRNHLGTYSGDVNGDTVHAIYVTDETAQFIPPHDGGIGTHIATTEIAIHYAPQ